MSFITVIRVVGFILGCLALYVAAFLFEAEDRVLKSRLESLWINLDENRRSGLARRDRLAQGAASLTETALTRTFGARLFSGRALLSSAALTIGFTASGFALVLWLATLVPGTSLAFVDFREALGVSAAGLFLVATVVMYGASDAVWLRRAATATQLLLMTVLVLAAVQVYSGPGEWLVVAAQMIGVLLSICTDFGFIVAIRLAAKRSKAASFYEALVLFVGLTIVAVTLVVAPIAPWIDAYMNTLNVDTEFVVNRQTLTIATMNVWATGNVYDLLLLIAVAGFFVMIALDHALRALFSRVLYQSIRHNLIDNKKTLWVAGVALVTSSIPAMGAIIARALKAITALV